MTPHTFCHFCGAKHTEKKFPKTCGACREITWRNPTPVVVAIVRTLGSGLLTVRRDIEPEKGELAFPGGYVDFGESWQEAAAREVFEETSELVKLAPEDFSLLTIETASNKNLLIFCACKTKIVNLDEGDCREIFKPNSEVSELKILRAPIKMAWKTHQEFAYAYFRGNMQWPVCT
jgi:8-oxo-dGTP diphosphatase